MTGPTVNTPPLPAGPRESHRRQHFSKLATYAAAVPLLQTAKQQQHPIPVAYDYREQQQSEPRQLTVRAVLVGLGVGSILCFSNTYFGLQTGWVTMGSLQSAILGFGIFKLLERFKCMKGFTVEENVIVQTTSVATATMPLAAGTFKPHLQNV